MKPEPPAAMRCATAEPPAAPPARPRAGSDASFAPPPPAPPPVPALAHAPPALGALVHVCRHGSPEQVAWVLQQRPALARERAPDGYSALHWTLASAAPLTVDEDARVRDVARCLLVHGADANAATADDWTPLMLAVDALCSPETLDLLLAYGADPAQRDAAGLSARDIADPRFYGPALARLARPE